MPISPDVFLRCHSDGWISIRDRKGRLLGAIPGSPPQEDYMQFTGPLGFLEVRAAMIHCLCPADEQIPHLRSLPGFVPVDDLASQADLAQPPIASGDDQEDIGRPV